MLPKRKETERLCVFFSFIDLKAKAYLKGTQFKRVNICIHVYEYKLFITNVD